MSRLIQTTFGMYGMAMVRTTMRVAGQFMEDGAPKYQALVLVFNERYGNECCRCIGTYDSLSGAKSKIENI